MSEDTSVSNAGRAPRDDETDGPDLFVRTRRRAPYVAGAAVLVLLIAVGILLARPLVGMREDIAVTRDNTDTQVALTEELLVTIEAQLETTEELLAVIRSTDETAADLLEEATVLRVGAFERLDELLAITRQMLAELQELNESMPGALETAGRLDPLD